LNEKTVVFMDGTCAVVNGEFQYVSWALHVFGECIYTPEQIASLILGLLSIACFATSQFNQIYKHYKLKAVPGLNPALTFFWLCGDISSLIGCIFAKQLPTQLYFAIYSVTIDTIVLAQIIYIKKRYPRDRILLDIQDPEIEHLLGDAEGGRQLYAVFPWPALIVINAATSPALDSSATMLAGYIIGWVSAICYIISRFPQLHKNWQRKATTGLSMWMFCATLSGNSFYTISIFLMSHDRDFIIQHLPWIVGAVVPLLLDICILFQFIQYYRRRS
jgi:solute carrier family 66 (lysosomal lysine-arginine transporter), member 1